MAMPSPSKKFLIHAIFIICSVLYRSRCEKPKIISRPTNENVYLNDSATFVCRVRSTLRFTINWLKYDGQMLESVPGSVIVVNDSLTFLHVRRSDDGIYTCFVENSAGSSSAQATLRVLDPPMAPRITEISSNQTVIEGTRITFICKASGNPFPKIIWKSPDTSSRLEWPSPESIRIPEASPRDAGRYVCTAENISGNDTDAVYLRVLGYPVFVVSPPSNLIVNETSTVNLDCKVIGLPTADVTWYYGNVPVWQIPNIIVLRNNTLRMSDIKFNNSGSYTCKANNSAGLQRSRSTLLQVKRAPMFACCPDELTVHLNHTAIEGQEASLDCSAVGYPEPEYEWIFENTSISFLAVLIISNTSRSINEGVYTCRTHNNLGEVSLIIYLNVLVPPVVTVQPQHMTAVQGDRVKFLCTATGVPLPVVTWYSFGGLALRNNTLVIANVSSSDQGNYICEAKNEAGLRTIRATLIVAVPPTFRIVPRNTSVNESSSVSIQCSAYGPDQPVITWYHLLMGGEKMKLNHSGDEMTIRRVNRSDSGFYLCEARNHAGFFNITFFINVQFRPYTLPSKQKVSIVESTAARLECPINANPAAEIRWTNPVSFEGRILTITKVDVSHAGQYSCTGSNLLGTTEATLTVQVLTSPRIIGLQLDELFNNFVSLSCLTTSTRALSMKWIDQTPLPQGSFSVHLGRLQIEKRYISSMQFVCNASNEYGWITKHIRVPSSPRNFSITKTLSNSIAFSWMDDTTEIITNFVIERRTIAELSWVTINSSVSIPWFEDHDLSAFTTFVYRVSARNVLGTSIPGDSINVSTSEGVPSRPSKLKAKSFSFTSVTICWKTPSKPRGKIANIIYEVSYKENTASSQDQVKITVNSTTKYELEIPNLSSNVLYVIKMRSGRQVDGRLQWSGIISVLARTLQEAPTITPEELTVTSNGPRRIFVHWKTPRSYVEGYKLNYKEYETRNVTTVVIKSWNTSNYMITGLTAGRYYEIQMNMFTSGGDGPWSHPIVVFTDQDRLALPRPVANSSDSLPWKIAVGVAALAILLFLVLIYVLLMRRSKRKESSEIKKSSNVRKKSRKQGGYDFTDNMSRVSNESEGSIEGVYNVNTENDIDLSMFDNSHHAAVAPEHLYVENPILPRAYEESDDDYEAVKLATFIARPSPLPTPHLTGRRQPSSSHVNPVYHRDDDALASYATIGQTAKTEPNENEDVPLYAQVDFEAKRRDRRTREDRALERFSEDILI